MTSSSISQAGNLGIILYFFLCSQSLHQLSSLDATHHHSLVHTINAFFSVLKYSKYQKFLSPELLE